MDVILTKIEQIESGMADIHGRLSACEVSREECEKLKKDFQKATHALYKELKKARHDTK